MNIQTRIFGILLFPLLSGCLTMSITTDYDQSVDFSRFKTYQWTPVPQKPTGDPRIDYNAILEKRIRNAVEAQLKLQEFEKTSSGTPDFFIGYHVAIEKQLDVVSMGNYYGYDMHYRASRGWGGIVNSTEVYEYDVGSLILDIVDQETTSLLWRGSAQARLDQSASPEKRRERINEAVRRILGKFPPK